LIYTVAARRDVIMGNRIKEIRKEKGIAQKELAEKLGVTPQAVSQFEKSDSLKFNYSTLQSLAAALECSVEDIVGPEVKVQLKIVMGSNEERLFSYILMNSAKLNRMGHDALANYLELLLNTEKYTSMDHKYLREVWGDCVYDKFYPDELTQIDKELSSQTAGSGNSGESLK
jgi:transcriptional regulator with XRE-family HTH domain